MGNPTEKSESLVVNVRIPRPWVEALDARAEELGLSRSQLIKAALPLPEQLAKSADVHPKATRDPVPRGEPHDRTEDLVSEGSSTRIADFSKQGIPIEPSHDNIVQSRARTKTQ